MEGNYILRQTSAIYQISFSIQNPEFDVTIVALMRADHSSSSSSSRCHLFPSSEAKTVALTRARKAIFIVGRGQDMEASDDTRDILAFAHSQYEDTTRNINCISPLPLDRSLDDVVNTLKTALAKTSGGATGPSRVGSFYSAPTSNYATPRLPYGIDAVVGGGGGGVAGGGGHGYQPVSE